MHFSFMFPAIKNYIYGPKIRRLDPIFCTTGLTLMKTGVMMCLGLTVFGAMG